MRYLPEFKFQEGQLLEVGLGCDMGYGPGKSAKLWREYFPKMDIHFVEFDGECVKKHSNKFTGINVHVGDQGDPMLMSRLVNSFDKLKILIDDGSHLTSHNIATMSMLLPGMEKNGVIFVEDAAEAVYIPNFRDHDDILNFDSSFFGFVKALATKLMRSNTSMSTHIFQMIECQRDICAFLLN